MISTDFAPNETLKDALASFKILIQPWFFKRGKSLFRVKQRLKKFFPNQDVFLFLTARAGLYRLLQALELEKSSKVLVQGFTCEAVILPILELGLKPVFVDIEETTYSFDIDSLQEKIDKKTKVLILQHTFGLTPIYRKKVFDLAKKHDIIVIEDLAHGFDSALFDESQTMRQYPHCALLLSFGRSKAISSVFGGAVVTRSKKLADRLKEAEKTLVYPTFLFILQCLIYKPLSVLIKASYDMLFGKVLHGFLESLSVLPKEISTKEKGGNFDPMFLKAYPNALAYLLQRQFKRFDQIQQHRLSISKIYIRHFLKNASPLVLQPYLRFPVLCENRDRLLGDLKKHQIFLGTWYEVISPRGVPLSKLGYRRGSCPNAERIAAKIVNLPTQVSEKQAKMLIKHLKSP